MTLSGDTNDTFVVNVTGRFMLTRGSQIVAAGVPASAILYNIIGDGQQVAMTGKTRIDGTVLALERDIAVTPGVVNGEVTRTSASSAGRACAVRRVRCREEEEGSSDSPMRWRPCERCARGIRALP